jgi:penicillin amidase
MPPFDPQTIVELVATPAGRNVALDTLDSAYAETRQMLGNDHARWQWGSLNQIRLQHPLLGLANGRLRTQMLLPRYPRGGSGNTTNATSYLADDFLVRSGASFRMVLDVVNWDAARATNAPGQSGDPLSRFYDNLLENWATEQHFPLLYTRQAIARHTAFTIRLEPRTPVDGDG